MTARVKFLDSSQNVYDNTYTFIIKFEEQAYKVETTIQVLRDLDLEGLVGYVNNFFPNLGGDFIVTKLS